jgi:hypothetical protein
MSKSKDANWKELLKSQNDDLKRFEEIDAELNEHETNLDAEISNALKKTSISKFTKPSKNSDNYKMDQTPIIFNNSKLISSVQALNEDDSDYNAELSYDNKFKNQEVDFEDIIDLTDRGTESRSN